MIIGKPITIGGGNNLPRITVFADAGSQIDILQGGVIILTYTLVGSETYHEFTLPGLGTYTIRVTKDGTVSERTYTPSGGGGGGSTAVIMTRTYLYDTGDKCLLATGGWSHYHVDGNSAQVTWLDEADRLEIWSDPLFASYWNVMWGGWTTDRPIKIPAGSKLKAYMSCNHLEGYPNVYTLFALSSFKPPAEGDFSPDILESKFERNIERDYPETVTIDLNLNHSVNAFVSFGSHSVLAGPSFSEQLVIRKLWIE